MGTRSAIMALEGLVRQGLATDEQKARYDDLVATTPRVESDPFAEVGARFRLRYAPKPLPDIDAELAEIERRVRDRLNPDRLLTMPRFEMMHATRRLA